MKTAQFDRQGIIRQSNFELLRIFAMVLIVAHHFSVHGCFEFSNETVTLNRVWVQFIQIGGKIGVDIFVLISGYFLINTISIKTYKVLILWLQVFTYSILIFTIFIFTGIESFSIKELIKNCFPITFSQWWFASVYFVLYLISPFINRLLVSFDKALFQRYLILLTIFWSIIPTFTGQSFQSNSLLWFIYLYSLAGYFKRYTKPTKIKGLTYILLSFVLIIITWQSAIIFDVLGTKIAVFGEYATFFYGMEKLPILVISVLLFVGFSNIKIKYCRVVNIVSSATFGVYLIHDNGYVQTFLWKTIFKNASYSDSSILIPYSLFAIITVFVCCTLIELLRIYILERRYMRIVRNISIRIDDIKEKMLPHSEM